MFQTTFVTWILIVFGVITCLPLVFAQLVILLDPKGQKAKEILIGTGEEWRDNSHFKSAYGMAMADWILFVPVFVLGILGILIKKPWGYLLFAVAGAIQLYINVFLWFFEREYVYPSRGAVKYYTYYWGNFIYWGLAALAYGILRFNGILI